MRLRRNVSRKSQMRRAALVTARKIPNHKSHYWAGGTLGSVGGAAAGGAAGAVAGAGAEGNTGGPAGAPGATGAPGVAGAKMDDGCRAPNVINVSVRLVAKNKMPRIAVVRVNALAAPRGPNKPPMPEPLPPMPSAPPSERCSKITTISAMAMNR